MMNEPAGTTTIAGQLSHSLKLSLGPSARSRSMVSGPRPSGAEDVVCWLKKLTAKIPPANPQSNKIPLRIDNDEERMMPLLNSKAMRRRARRARRFR
jgi:hypothetical protein